MAGDWLPQRLGDLIQVKHGWPFQSQFFSEERTGRPVVVGIGNFQYTGGFRFESTTVKEYLGEYPKEFELEPGDMLLVMTCQTSGGEILGIPGRIPNDGSLYLHNQRMGKVVIKDTSKVRPDFLYWLFLSKPFNRHLAETATGTKILHTAPARIEDFSFYLPPPNEQKAIAHILGTLDDKIELNRRMNETLEAMARALFKSWFVDFDPVRAKAEGRDPGLPKQLAGLFPDSFEESELGEIPKGWRIVRVAELADINARTLGRSDPLDMVDYIEISEVMRGEIREVVRYARGTEPSRARRRLAHGDAVLSSVRPDRGAHFLCLDPTETLIASTGFVVLSPRKGNWAFLYSALTRQEVGEDLGRLADGGAYPALRPEAIGKLCLVEPNAAEIVSVFERLTRPLLERSAKNRHASRAIAEVRDALLPKLISGEIRVSKAESLVEAQTR